MATGPETLWDKIRDTADTFASTVVLHGFPVTSNASGGNEDITIEIRGTLNCAAASGKSLQENKQYDYFLLTQSLGVTPPPTKEIAMYVVIMRALKDPSTPFAKFPAESQPIANWWTGEDDFSDYRWKASGSDTLPNSVWMSTDPKGADNTVSYSCSSSVSVGVNAGFFGGTLTGGIDVNWTLSHSESVTLIPVKIVDSSTNDTLQIAFIPHQQKSSDFQPVLQGILQIEDDGLGKRSKTDADARKIAFELRVIILPKAQLKTAYEDKGNTLYQAYHEFSRVIHLNLPQAPKA